MRPLTPWLSAHWVGLVTPVPNAIARPLVASLIHEAVATSTTSPRYVPDPHDGLTGFDDAVRLALRKIRDARRGDPLVERRPAGRADATRCPSDPDWSGGSVYTDERDPRVDAAARARCGG